jgi:hypothetical protein
MGKAWCAGRSSSGLPQPDYRDSCSGRSLADICFWLVVEWFIYIPVPKILESKTKQKEVKCIFFFCCFLVPERSVLRLTADLAHESAKLLTALLEIIEHIVACAGGA